jgi:hypothetical protein
MGRPKGSPNKTTGTRERAVERAGITPLAFMLETLRSETKPHEERMKAAVAAAPYVHPRLSQIDAKHSGTLDVRAWLMTLKDDEA